MAPTAYIPRGPHIVEMLARDGFPVMCHLGLVPRRSTWRGGLKAIGSTAEEALELFQDFKTMEGAGAFSVEAEVICAPVMAEISKRTTLITSSLGSVSDADIQFLFQNDVCGESDNPPRPAQAFGNLATLYKQISDERCGALSKFASTARNGQFPNSAQATSMAKDEFEKIMEKFP